MAKAGTPLAVAVEALPEAARSSWLVQRLLGAAAGAKPPEASKKQPQRPQQHKQQQQPEQQQDDRERRKEALKAMLREALLGGSGGSVGGTAVQPAPSKGAADSDKAALFQMLPGLLAPRRASDEPPGIDNGGILQQRRQPVAAAVAAAVPASRRASTGSTARIDAQQQWAGGLRGDEPRTAGNRRPAWDDRPLALAPNHLAKRRGATPEPPLALPPLPKKSPPGARRPARRAGAGNKPRRPGAAKSGPSGRRSSSGGSGGSGAAAPPACVAGAPRQALGLDEIERRVALQLEEEELQERCVCLGAGEAGELPHASVALYHRAPNTPWLPPHDEPHHCLFPSLGRLLRLEALEERARGVIVDLEAQRDDGGGGGIGIGSFSDGGGVCTRQAVELAGGLVPAAGADRAALERALEALQRADDVGREVEARWLGARGDGDEGEGTVGLEAAAAAAAMSGSGNHDGSGSDNDTAPATAPATAAPAAGAASGLGLRVPVELLPPPAAQRLPSLPPPKLPAADAVSDAALASILAGRRRFLRHQAAGDGGCGRVGPREEAAAAATAAMPVQVVEAVADALVDGALAAVARDLDDLCGGVCEGLVEAEFE